MGEFKNWYIVIDGNRNTITSEVSSGWKGFELKIFLNQHQLYRKTSMTTGSVLFGTYAIPVPNAPAPVELRISNRPALTIGKANLNYQLTLGGQEVQEGRDLFINLQPPPQAAAPQSAPSGAQTTNDDIIIALKKRLALGEINEEEYQRLLKIIQD